ncbi:YbfB/YjiJ family MFS transporter [Rhodococcus sp. UNC363MFTsu5.1]|uniref:YbfB/YjiJ family MFS transporter n=1 Tax=Rhodococcus sp. UNC363MFTsu5.1 TaxID=1449069 RepID=UPI00068DAF88|nr:YbfB/YjiJ family MFS transporter [Rhodococcus sp. UNC363MFTsu5.1]
MVVTGGNDRMLVLRASLTLAVAMGLGRFAFTPILPLMVSQAGLTAESAATLATANYLGYLVGAVVAIFAHWIPRSRAALRVSLVLLIATLALMPAAESMSLWLTLRFLAGVASAVLFVFTARVAHQQVTGGGDGVGWVFGGIGAGIALSGCALLALGSGGSWRVSWLVVAALAAVLALFAWSLPGGDPVAAASAGGPTPVSRRARRRFGWLMAAYFCEGVGYIVSATFIVAAVASIGSATWLGSAVWIAVGLAGLPSCVLWIRLSRRHSRVAMLAVAFAVQIIGVGASALFDSTAVQLLAALAFGGTFMGIVMLTLAEGAELVGPRAPAIGTSLYGLGQVLGPLMVAPLLDTGYSRSLAVAAGILVLGLAFLVPLLRTGRVDAPEPEQVVSR